MNIYEIPTLNIPSKEDCFEITNELLLYIAIKCNYKIALKYHSDYYVDNEMITVFKDKVSTLTNVSFRNDGEITLLVNEALSPSKYINIQDFSNFTTLPKEDVSDIHLVICDEIYGDEIPLCDFSEIETIAQILYRLHSDTDGFDRELYKKSFKTAYIISSKRYYNHDYHNIDLNDNDFDSLPTYLHTYFMLGNGYKLLYKKGNVLEYISDGTNTAKHNVLKGCSQKLGFGQRIFYFIYEKANNITHCVVKCDCGTRTIFNGVITSKKDFLTLIKLLD
jgi:hypothetical protein